jgi:predicted kinase
VEIDSKKRLPLLLVVTGRPGSGKTTLAHALAKAIRGPAIVRDEIKEGLVNTTAQTGQPRDDIQRLAYDAFFDTIRLLVDRRITLVAEAAFQHKLWEPKLQPLRQIARIRIIVCQIDPKLARQRHIERGLADPKRQRFHDDLAMQELPIGEYDPPHLDVPTLRVDTTNAYLPEFQQIVEFAGLE